MIRIYNTWCLLHCTCSSTFKCLNSLIKGWFNKKKPEPTRPKDRLRNQPKKLRDMYTSDLILRRRPLGWSRWTAPATVWSLTTGPAPTGSCPSGWQTLGSFTGRKRHYFYRNSQICLCGGADAFLSTGIKFVADPNVFFFVRIRSRLL